ncbi:MAG: YlzJ-like family protein [Halanaerobiales bacterium]
MLNYSIYPLEMILEDYDDFVPEYEEVNFSNGLTLLVERSGKDERKIAKIISSDPQDYLRPELQPGSILKSVFYY